MDTYLIIVWGIMYDEYGQPYYGVQSVQIVDCSLNEAHDEAERIHHAIRPNASVPVGLRADVSYIPPADWNLEALPYGACQYKD